MGSILKNYERRLKKELKSPLHDFFAVVRPGFESECLSEIHEIIGINDIDGMNIETGGVHFKAKLEQMWELHLRSFTISSVRMRIGSFRAGTEGEAAAKIKSIPWELYLPSEASIKVQARLRQCRLPDAPLLCRIAEREIASVVSRFYKELPDNETEDEPKLLSGQAAREKTEAEQQVLIRGEKNRYEISIDCSGSRFYSRGYRQHTGHAPLRETTAALILRTAGFQKYRTLLDPMCGSGTFSLEAAAVESGVLPGYERCFPFFNWPSFRPAAWNHLVKKALSRAEKTSTSAWKLSAVATDNSSRALKDASLNLNLLQQRLENQNPDSSITYKKNIQIKPANFFDITYWKDQPVGPDTLIVLNPPYGKRVEADLTLYERIGKILNGPLAEAAAAVIVPGREAEEALGIRIDKKVLFFNGGIKCGLLLREG